MQPDILVVGAGIHGCSVALQLAMRGASVTVVEKSAPGAHASGVNAGSVHHIAKLVSELPLAELTLRMWHRISDLVEEDCGFRCVGHLKLAECEEDMTILERMSQAVGRASSIPERLIDRDELQKMEPNVSPYCVGGLFSPDCGYALPAETVDAFRAKAMRLGVRFILGEAVKCLRRDAGKWSAETPSRTFTAPVVVNCAGAWGDRIAAELGDHVTLTPLALQMIVLARMPPVMNTVIAFTRRILSVKQFGNGTVLIGGGFRGKPDISAGLAHLDLACAGYNLRTAMEAYPLLARGQVVRCWAGLEGRSPDGFPIIGPGSSEGVWHAFGFSSHGFYLGPAVGAVLADLITGAEPPVSVAPYLIERFSNTPGACQQNL